MKTFHEPYLVSFESLDSPLLDQQVHNLTYLFSSLLRRSDDMLQWLRQPVTIEKSEDKKEWPAGGQYTGLDILNLVFIPLLLPRLYVHGSCTGDHPMPQDFPEQNTWPKNIGEKSDYHEKDVVALSYHLGVPESVYPLTVYNEIAKRVHYNPEAKEGEPDYYIPVGLPSIETVDLLFDLYKKFDFDNAPDVHEDHSELFQELDRNTINDLFKIKVMTSRQKWVLHYTASLGEHSKRLADYIEEKDIPEPVRTEFVDKACGSIDVGSVGGERYDSVLDLMYRDQPQ